MITPLLRHVLVLFIGTVILSVGSGCSTTTDTQPREWIPTEGLSVFVSPNTPLLALPPGASFSESPLEECNAAQASSHCGTVKVFAPMGANWLVTRATKDSTSPTVLQVIEEAGFVSRKALAFDEFDARTQTPALKTAVLFSVENGVELQTSGTSIRTSFGLRRVENEPSVLVVRLDSGE